MADYSDLTPEQWLMLRQLGLMGSAPSQAFGGGSEAGPVNFGGMAVETDRGQVATGNVMAALPFDNGALRAGVNAMTATTPQMSMSQFSPNVGLQLGPVGGQYGVQLKNGEMAGQSFGGDVNLGPAKLGYSRFNPERGAPSDTYSVSVPYEDMNFRASVMRGKEMPTRYELGANVPGLLGGDFSLAGSYEPERKDKAVYGRWSKRF